MQTERTHVVRQGGVQRADNKEEVNLGVTFQKTPPPHHGQIAEESQVVTQLASQLSE